MIPLLFQCKVLQSFNKGLKSLYPPLVQWATLNFDLFNAPSRVLASPCRFLSFLQSSTFLHNAPRRARHQTAQPSERFPREPPRSSPYKQNPLYYKNREQSNKGKKQVNKQNDVWTCRRDEGGITRIRRVYVWRWKCIFYSGVWDWREQQEKRL